MTYQENTAHHQLHATASSDGMRLDKFIAEHITELSRSRIQGLIETLEVQVNAETIGSCAFRIKEGDYITLTIPPAVDSHMRPANIPLHILFEDAHMLVVNKPAGLTVHPGAGNHDDTMANALLAHCGDQLSGIGGVCRPGIVHRLDKDTSGLLVVAKTDKAHHSLSGQIASRSLKRQYIAVVWGVPTPALGIITGNIARSTRDRTKMTVVQTGGREAITHYRIKEVLAEGAATVVECRLETGRTHQIRLHFTTKGYPVIGDSVYSGNPKRNVPLPVDIETYARKFPRQALHSRKIGFCHPETGEYMEYETPLPDDMQSLIAVLKGEKR